MRLHSSLVSLIFVCASVGVFAQTKAAPTCADLKLIPATLDFGNVNVGTSSPNMVIRVNNVTHEKVELKNISITGHDKGDYYQFNTCAKSLNPKSTCSVVIEFIPTRKGARNAAISVDVEGLGSNPKSAALVGTGT